MIDGSEKHNRQLAFKLQNSRVCEKRSNKQVILRQSKTSRNFELDKTVSN